MWAACVEEWNGICLVLILSLYSLSPPNTSMLFLYMVTHKWKTSCCHPHSDNCWRERESERGRKREREVWKWSDVFWQFGIWDWKRGGIIALIMEGRENIAQHNIQILFFPLLSTHFLRQSNHHSLYPHVNTSRITGHPHRQGMGMQLCMCLVCYSYVIIIYDIVQYYSLTWWARQMHVCDKSTIYELLRH